MAKPRKRAAARFVVCGMGHVGRRVALLLRRLGHNVAAVYDSGPDDWINEAALAGVTCIQGDARDERVLEKAGVATASGLIAATDKDMVNLSVALDGARANPGIATVVRLYDQELGRQVKPELNLRQVLSASALAAPMFVAAAVGRDAIAYFDYRGHHYVVTESGAGDASSDGRLLSDLGGAGSAPEGLRIEAVAGPSQSMTLWRRIAKRWHVAAGAVARLPWGVRWLGAGLAALLLMGVTLSRFYLGLGYVDALYFVITTITTTGYGDISLLNAPTGMKVFGSLLMISGAATLAIFFGFITDAVISSRFRGAIGVQRVREADHVIVAGAGHIMVRTVEELTAEHLPVVAICPDDRDAPALSSLHVPFIIGDVRMESALRRLGIETASAFIAVHDDDALNLGAALLAKKLCPSVRTVLRVFDGALAEKLQRRFDLDRVYSVSAVSAPVFVAACLFDRVLCATVWRDHLLFVRAGTDLAEPVDGRVAALYLDTATGALCCHNAAETTCNTDRADGVQVCALPLRAPGPGRTAAKTTA